MKHWYVGLFAILALVACQSGDEGKQTKTLSAVADEAQQAASGERLAGIEKRLDNIDSQLTQMNQRLAQGVPVAAAAATAKAPEATKAPEDTKAQAPADAQKPAEAAQPAADAQPATKPFELTWTPQGKVRVVLWHAYRGREKEALDECLKQFTAKYPNFEVDAQEVPFSAMRDKVTVTVPKGTGPDLFVFAHNAIGDWVFKGGILAPLSTLVEQYDDFETLEQRYLPSTLKALGYEGTLYGLPLAFKSHALFYNKKIIKEVPKTVDELVVMAKKAQDEGGKTDDDRVFGLLYDAGLLYNHALWAHAFGATLLDAEGNAKVNSDAMIESVKLVQSLANEKGILGNLDDNMGTFLFNAGRVAFLIKGSWFLGEVDPNVEYGVALLPSVADGKVPKPFLGSEGVFLSQTSQQKEAAFQVMRYLVSDEAAQIRFLKGQQLVANSAIYENKELLAKANPALDLFRKQADQTVVMPSRPEMQAVWSTVDNALRKAVFGGVDAKQALDEAQAKVESDIAKMRQR